MNKLSSRQKKQAFLIAVLLSVTAASGVGAWLLGAGEDTLQRRRAVTPFADFWLVEKPVEKAPASWQETPKEEPVKQEAKAEEVAPEAKPEQATEQPVAEKAEAEKPVAEQPAQTPIPEKTEPAAKTETEAPASTEAAPQAEQQPVAAMPEAKALPVAKPAWQKFARSFDATQAQPRIGLVIGNLGLARSATQAAIQDMPGDVTLAFSSLSPDIETNVASARAAGHEVLLGVPMEPDNYPQNDPGPNALLVQSPNDENVKRLQWALARSEGYVGVMPMMGEKFVTQEDKLVPVLQTLKQEGLLFLDATGVKASTVAPLSRLARMPFARGDIKIDASAARNAIDAQLIALEQLAREHGQAIGVALPYPVTFEKLKAWIATLEEKGLVLAPVTALVSGEAPAAAIENTTEAAPATEESPQP